ncbi:MAG TPA: MFS transporter [Bacteroidales bacterium]|nr:MFS transporter [Bacteroidales bacterium]HPT02323.1 MFS transporter [Bacteroidales bacterium]
MEQKNNSNLKLGMSFMAAIFFIFGFLTNFNIAMKDQVQLAFDLKTLYPGWENFLAQLVNGVFFFAYACFSFLCGGIIKKIGYKSGVITGLVLAGLGSYLFFPAVEIVSYPLFLVAVFVMATGVVFLQTAANPYVAALGSQETSAARLNLTQALNSLATTIAPFLAGILVLSPAVMAISNGSTPAEAAKFVQMPFIVIGSIVLLVGIGLAFVKLPVITGDKTIPSKSVLKKPQVWLGAIGIFCYVGAEVGTAGQIPPYLKESGFGIDVAVKLSAIYWGGAMIGRFFGSILLSKIQNARKYQYSALVMVFAFFVGWFITSSSVTDGKFVFESQPLNGLIFFAIAVINFFLMLLGKGKANVALGIFGTVNMILIVAAYLLPADLGMWCLLSIGFFNSIMFPNIFSLGVSDLDPSEMPIAAGIINTLIVGGAVVPLLMGAATDSFSARGALIIPIICYAYITFFALKGSKIR